MSLLDLYVLNFLFRPTEVWKSTFRPFPGSNTNIHSLKIFVVRICVLGPNLFEDPVNNARNLKDI